MSQLEQVILDLFVWRELTIFNQNVCNENVDEET